MCSPARKPAACKEKDRAISFPRGLHHLLSQLNIQPRPTNHLKPHLYTDKPIATLRAHLVFSRRLRNQATPRRVYLQQRMQRATHPKPQRASLEQSLALITEANVNTYLTFAKGLVISPPPTTQPVACDPEVEQRRLPIIVALRRAITGRPTTRRPNRWPPRARPQNRTARPKSRPAG